MIDGRRREPKADTHTHSPPLLSLSPLPFDRNTHRPLIGLAASFVGGPSLNAPPPPPLGLLGNDNKIEISRYLSVYYLPINTSDTLLL